MTLGNGEMTEEVAKAAVDYVVKRSGSYVRVNFFGGEPLLRFDLIQYVVDYIKTATEKPVKLDIVTNGTLLTQEFFDYAEENKIRISLSYDGLANSANRVNEDGKDLLDISKYREEIKKYQIVSASVLDVNNIGMWHDNIVHLKELGFRFMDFFIKYQSPWKKHHVEIMREEYRKIAESYVRWMNEGDKVSITKLDDMIGAYMSKFKLDKVRMVRDYAYSIDVNGDIYPYASAVGNKKLLLGNVVTGEETQAMSTLEKAGMVESCRNCCINDACVASKGNEITDDLVPRAYPIACASYKFAFDAADYIVNARLDNFRK
jgi:uncharacterized protein